MRRPGGQMTQVMRDGRVVENDTFTCAHGTKCGQAIVVVKPYEDPSAAGGFCRMCMRHICAACAATGKCEPFERRLEEVEKRDRMFRSMGIG